MASQCYFVGRIDAAIRYTEAAEKVISTGGVKVPHGASGFVGGAYVFAGHRLAGPASRVSTRVR